MSPLELRPGGERPDISIIVVSYNTAAILERLFDTINAGRGSLDIQIIVVDNASQDESIETIRRHCPEAELIVNSRNIGFGRANNQALPKSQGRYILLLNTDAFIERDTLRKTVGYMDAHPECGVVGVKLVDEDGAVQPSCRFFPSPFGIFLAATGLRRWFPGVKLLDDPSWDPSISCECDWVPGCFYFLRREVAESCGLFDPRYFLYCEELDHCRSVKTAGWKVGYYSGATVIHVGGQSANSLGELEAASWQVASLQIESELLYFRKHAGWLGVVSAVIFRVLAEIVIALKAIMRKNRSDFACAALRNILLVLRLFNRTRFGLVSTR